MNAPVSPQAQFWDRRKIRPKPRNLGHCNDPWVIVMTRTSVEALRSYNSIEENSTFLKETVIRRLAVLARLKR